MTTCMHAWQSVAATLDPGIVSRLQGQHSGIDSDI